MEKSSEPPEISGALRKSSLVNINFLLCLVNCFCEDRSFLPLFVTPNTWNIQIEQLLTSHFSGHALTNEPDKP